MAQDFVHQQWDSRNSKNEEGYGVNEAYLRLAGITKSFKTGAGRKTVVRDLTLDVHEGEFITVLGPSGCGKTTVLSILAGLLAPDCGSVLVNGRDITAQPPEKRQFGVVFQNYALFPNLTVAENIAYGLHGWVSASERDERVREMLALIDMASLSNTFPSRLSGGQQQRTALARALAPRPMLLLLDEPLSALDARIRASLGEEILRIQRHSGITTIMVTHDQQEALALADRIVLMNEGQIVQYGPPNELYNAPQARFVAEFVGHMNIVTIPGLNNGKETGLRYEDVLVAEPTEASLSCPHTWVGQIRRAVLMGAFYRLEILLNDFSTTLYADVPCDSPETCLTVKSLVAVTLPQTGWRHWEA